MNVSRRKVRLPLFERVVDEGYTEEHARDLALFLRDSVAQMRTTDVEEQARVIEAVVSRIEKDVFPFGLSSLIDTVNSVFQLSVFAPVMSQLIEVCDGRVVAAFLRLLVILLDLGLPGLREMMCEEPGRQFLMNCVKENKKEIVCDVVNVLILLCQSCECDLSEFFLVLPRDDSEPYIELFSEYVGLQLQWIPVDDHLREVFDFVLSSPNFEAAKLLLNGIVSTSRSKIAVLLNTLRDQHWLSIFDEMTKYREPEVVVMGFKVLRALIDQDNPGSVVLPEDVICMWLQSDQNEASLVQEAIVDALITQVKTDPAVIDMLVKPALDHERSIFDFLFHLLDHGEFSLRKRVLKLVCAVVKHGSTVQVKRLSMAQVFGGVLDMGRTEMSSKEARQMLSCISRAHRISKVSNEGYNTADLFLAFDGPEVLSHLHETFQESEVATMIESLAKEFDCQL